MDTVVKQNRKRNKRRSSRVLMSMDGQGMKSSWIKFQLPTWLVVCMLLAALVGVVALFVSPDLAGKLGAVLASWFAAQKP